MEVSNQTGAAIACHSPVGANALHQLKMIEQTGGDTSRYIQVHAHAEPRYDVHMEVLRHGAWIEYDGIGGQPDSLFLGLVRKVFDAGFGHRLLLSQDVCSYLVDKDPNTDDREYAYLVNTFTPALSDAGFSASEIDQLARANPAEAFSIDSR
jgi:phosphotriesterase-related protein